MRQRYWVMVSTILLILAIAFTGSAQVKLTYWAGWMTEEHQQAERRIVEDFMREHPGIEVEFIHLSNPWDQIPLGHATGTIGDVVISSRDDFPNWQGMGIFRDLTPWLNQEPGFADEFVDQLMPLFQGPDGRQFGLPFSSNGRGLFRYKVDDFDAAGVVHPGLDPWSWTELVDNARKLVRHNEDGEVIHQGIRIDVHPMNIWTWFWANDTDLWTSDFAKSTVNSPNVEETLQFLHDLIHVHQVAAPIGPSVPWAIRGGAGPWDFQRDYQAWMEGESETRIMWNPYNGDAKRIAMVGGSGMHIAARSRHPEEAWLLLKYLTSEEAQWRRFNEGYGTGSRKEHLVRVSQLQESVISEPKQLYWDVFTYGLPQPTFPRYREWQAPFERFTTQALNGEISIQEAIIQIEHYTNLLLGQ